MKILLSLPESPFDPTNGAARSMRTIAEFMAQAGHQVRCVATSATEHAGTNDWGHIESRGVNYWVIDSMGLSSQRWRTPKAEAAFDALFQMELDEKPDLLLCYGGHPTDMKRYIRAKRVGVKIVFGLRNYGYQKRGFLDFADGIITSSQFLTDWYRIRFGVESTPLPLPIWPEDVIAEKREPRYFTAINPTREKGLMILETVFGWLEVYRPDIPCMVTTDAPDKLSKEAFWHTLIQPWQANPKEIFARTKVLLVPSVWEEPAGRVIAEAMLNGIPPIITDRGGMPEVANGGAFILPLAKTITPQCSVPVKLSVAQPWIDVIIRLHDDPQYYFDAVRCGLISSGKYDPRNVIPLYEAYFERILAGQPVAEHREPVHSLPALEQFDDMAPTDEANA
jgi:glycosyltransferase involved in cell wall biosynthesis